METSIYVTLSGQKAAERRLDTIAHNLANASTPGFKAEEVSFSTILSRTGLEPVAFATKGTNFVSRQPGAVIQTGNPLDLAVSGDGWFGVETPSGPAYTRDGRITITSAGELRSVAGHYFVDQGGARLLVAPAGGPVQIAPDGTLTQSGVRRGVVGLFTIDEAAELTRIGDSAYLSNTPAIPVTDFTANSIKQGYIEQSNVNPIAEMASMISLMRNFEAVSSGLDQSDKSLREAIRSLGSGGQ